MYTLVSQVFDIAAERCNTDFHSVPHPTPPPLQIKNQNQKSNQNDKCGMR